MSDAQHHDELIKLIAQRHGVAVGRDDPILILHTLNQRLLDDSAQRQVEILDTFKSELESIAFRWGEDSKTKAERILTAALAASKEAMTKVAQEATAAAVERLRREVQDAAKIIAKPARQARTLALINITAALMTLGSAGLVAWALFNQG